MGSNSGWAIDFYVGALNTSISKIGSFRDSGERWEDIITTFDGFYGTNYMVWKTMQDLKEYDFSKLSINLKLFHEGNPRRPYFHEYYRVIDTGYDEVDDRYYVVGISEESSILQVKLSNYGITSLQYNPIRTTEMLLEEVLVAKNVIPVIWHEHSDFEKKHNKYEYKTFSVQPDWTIGDFISYVCSERGLEWCFSYGVLHIGKELKANKDFDATKFDFSEAGDSHKVSRSPFTYKIDLSASPCGPLYFLEPNWRCLWTRHMVGAKGDETRACFSLISEGSFDTDRFISTLEKSFDKSMCLELMRRNKTKKFNSNMIGLTMTDSGILADQKVVEEISVDRDEEQLSLKDPWNVPIRTKEQMGWYFLKKVARSSPYLDNMAGLLFPAVKDPPNQLIHNVDDRIEQAVAGNFVFGRSDPLFLIPKKNPDDFRLQFPNGWCLYVKDDGETYLQLNNTPHLTTPVVNQALPHLHLKPDGTITINKDAVTKIEIDNSGKISIQSTSNNVEVNCLNAKIVATVKSEVDAPLVEIGKTATSVALSTGTFTLAHGNHTHSLTPGFGNLGLPLAGSSLACLDNTTITKAD